MFSIVLAAISGLSLLSGDPQVYTAPRCREVVRMEPVAGDSTGRYAAKVLRSIAGDVIMQKSGNGRASQTAANRVAEEIRGVNPGREYREVRRTVCEPDYVRPNPTNSQEPR